MNADFWAMAGPLTAFLGLIGALFNFSVIKPLNASVRQLEQVINKLDAKIEAQGREFQAKFEEQAREIQEMRLKATQLEQSLKYAHKRITEAEEEIKERHAHDGEN